MAENLDADNGPDADPSQCQKHDGRKWEIKILKNIRLDIKGMVSESVIILREQF